MNTEAKREAVATALNEFAAVVVEMAALHSSYTHATLQGRRREVIAELVDLIAPATPALRSLKEHNDAVLAATHATVKGGTGIACPHCGAELFFVDNAVMMSSPAQRSTRCVNNHFHNIYVRG